MKTEEILNHFEHQAKVGKWDSLYDPKNPESFSFIVRLQKTLNLLKDVNNNNSPSLNKPITKRNADIISSPYASSI